MDNSHQHTDTQTQTNAAVKRNKKKSNISTNNTLKNVTISLENSNLGRIRKDMNSCSTMSHREHNNDNINPLESNKSLGKEPHNFNQGWTAPQAYRKAYHQTWRDILIKAAIAGLILGQLACLMLGLPWPLTPLGFLGVALILTYYKYMVSPSDLTDWQIAKLETTGIIHPFDIQQVEPDSYDVLLGSSYTRVGKNGVEETWESDEVIVQPGECLLAHTIENFKFPNNIKGILQGKSSWARLSLFVECAGLFDKGFEGTAVLELFNASPNAIKLKRGDRIAQMSFHRTHPASLPYGSPLRTSHYQKQQGSKTSWLTKKDRIVKIGR
jgi:dCTP deaminase